MPERTLLRNAAVLTMDEDLGELAGDVLIEDGVILDVAESLPADGAEVVELDGAIVMP